MIEKEAFVITGAGQGLGRALAKEAYAQGFSVALVGRTPRTLRSLMMELELERSVPGQKISVHGVDLVDEKSVQREVSKISKTHGKIRALINNAGTWCGGKRIEELTRTDLQQALEQNFFSAFFATQAVLKAHRQRSSRGRAKPFDLSIVFVGATSSLQGWDQVGAFCVGKGAMRTMAQSLAREVGADGIHVAHLVLDGLLDNERTRALNPKLPVNRFLKQQEVAKSILTVALQDRSCWTFEWDLRPYNESW